MNLLVVKLHALGDFIIHTPAFEILRKGLPDARITLLTTDWAAPAAENLDFFDDVISVAPDLFFKRSFGSLRRLIELSIRLMRARFDTVVSFHLSKNINVFLKFSNPFVPVYAYNFQDSRRAVKLDEHSHSAPNACKLSNMVLRELGSSTSWKTDDACRYSWSISETELQQGIDLLQRSSIDTGRFALLFPGGGTNPRSSAPEKRWRADGYAAVANWLNREIGLQVILAGSNDDMAVCEDVSRQAEVRTTILSGRANIRIMAALMSMARIVITNDSAPLHISAAVKAPTLAIFGPTGSAHKLPPGDWIASVSLGLPCSPCYYSIFKGCIFTKIRCMEELSAQKVIAAASVLLKDSALSSNE